MQKLLLLFLLLGVLTSVPTQAQTIPFKPRQSQMALAIYKPPGGGYVKIHYGQPLKRNRVIFGDLVPYNVVWRTGANEATELTTLTDLRFADGKVLAAGTYSLFTVPQPDKWTIVFNAELGMWGDYEYDRKQDVLRFEVPVRRTPESYEALFIQLVDKGPAIEIRWDQTLVVVPFEVVAAP